jgi:Formin Homology 2 Domain
MNWRSPRKHTEVTLIHYIFGYLGTNRNGLVNLQEVRKGLTEIRDGLKAIRQELSEHFSDVESLPPEDRYAKKMWRFVGESTDRIEDLVDEVNLAETTFSEVVKYYGEDDKNMSSSEFYGIFKTFVTSYRVCVHSSWQKRLACNFVTEMQIGQPIIGGRASCDREATAAAGGAESY